MSYAGKVVWVTGASSGIGEALVSSLLQAGAQVILSGRRLAELERVAASAADRTLILAFETTDYDALPQVVEKAWAWKGRIDILINNAGISQRSLALDTHLDVYRQLIEVDYLAPLALTQLIVPRMVEKRSGHVAVISSVAGKVGTPLRTGYCGAKHAVVGYFDGLRAEVEEAYGIKVSVILPGSVQTSIAVNALVGDGSSRGRSDANIDNGMPVAAAAKIILDGMAAGKREIPVAEGKELAALNFRTQDPERLFDMLAKEGARLAGLRDEGKSIDPSDIRS
ncbi:SDR family NAD(P)-dependent oxidoreductase [Undibacterium terreum]|uniref:Oxidoreductase n=1 Tax=Undibacterium terreum TaxID=1224302 RepID=A0A916V1Z7_9BURK|nr:SDR family NAD(P)-dependent oxidoreductase [Undibacterium terreum]GGC98153.1 oxidoreductase [Undibacterium terreum]